MTKRVSFKFKFTPISFHHFKKIRIKLFVKFEFTIFITGKTEIHKLDHKKCVDDRTMCSATYHACDLKEGIYLNTN